MLLEFKVTNFRSIQESQVLSLVANKDPSLQESNCLSSGLTSIPKLVRAAVIYGSNASGKSNLILAMAMMRDVVVNSAVGIREGDKYNNIIPFLFDSVSAEQPTELEITFLEDGVRYQYGFAINQTRVVKEWLLVYKARKSQCWFEREYNQKTAQYDWYFGPHLLDSQRHNLWKESTRANALFLSTAVNLNSEQLRPIYNWFFSKLVIIFGGFPIPITSTLEYLKNPDNKNKLLTFLQAADLGITDVEAKVQKVKRMGVKLDFSGLSTVGVAEDSELPIVNLYHKSVDDKKINLLLEHESHGTQKLFAYAGPLFNVFNDGCVLVVDELESGLHPKMVQFLVNLLYDNELNNKNAQLIFTTHQTSLLDSDYLRRDQIWFVEKNTSNASVLYPLMDFSPRKSENIERGYLQGRFGAIPFLGEMKF